MRGGDQQPDAMFSYVSMEDRIPQDHPLRAMRDVMDAALRDMSPRFTLLYAKTGRPSIAPEKLLRAQLLQILYTIRSERLLMEQLDYNLLFRWFVGLSMDEAVWDATVFTKNRERLLADDVARALLDQGVAAARARHLLSSEHFSVDGTLIEAWASLKSFQRKDAPAGSPPDDPGNPTIDFHGERRRNETHASTTDPEARLFRKGKGHEAKLCHQGHVLKENRHGLAVDGLVTPPAGTAEREAAVEMLSRVPQAGRLTLGADKGYDTREFVDVLREMAVTPQPRWRVVRSSISLARFVVFCVTQGAESCSRAGSIPQTGRRSHPRHRHLLCPQTRGPRAPAPRPARIRWAQCSLTPSLATR